MAYNPGISYDTQSMGQGIQQGAQNLAMGLREMQANRTMAGQALARFEATAAANPDILKFLDAGQAPSAAASAYKSLLSGGTLPVQKAAILAQFADTFTTQQKQAQEAKAREMQLRQFQMQAQQQGAQMRRDDLARNYAMSGAGSGILSPALQNNPFFKQRGQALAAGTDLSAAQMLEAQARNETAMAKPDKAQPEQVTLPGGERVAFSPSTGAFSVLPQTPQQLADAESAKAEADLSVKQAGELLGGISESADIGRKTVSTVDRILGLYDQGVQSGFGQQSLTQAKSALSRFIPVKDLGNQQEFENAIANLALTYRRELTKGTGQVSDYETKMIERAFANPNLTPQANIAILKTLKNQAERSVKLDELRTRLEDEGKSRVEIARAVRRMRDSIDIGVDALVFDEGVAEGEQAAATVQTVESLLEKYK